MFSAGGAVRLIARRAAATVVGTSAVGAASLTLYSETTEGGSGFKREATFWLDVGPVVFDYWWNCSASSPKVRLRDALLLFAARRRREGGGERGEVPLRVLVGVEGGDGGTTSTPASSSAAEDTRREETRRRKITLNELHERNAPRIFQSMIGLGGLYVKLGQVLSVTALPVPEQYRALFRTLQSDVPNPRDFDTVIRPTLERELLGAASSSSSSSSSLREIFDAIDEVPCGAASIGQAHRAVLKSTGEEVIVKVQYPEARWQIPADVRCVGDFLNLCVLFGIVDGPSSKMSHDEFSRQFLSELDYDRERMNLDVVHRSSLDPNAPYIRRGVVVPRPHGGLCTGRVVTMTYLPGPKFEEEARRHLASLGVDVTTGGRGGGMRDVVMMGRQEAVQRNDDGTTTTRNDDGTDDGNAGSATSEGDDRGSPPPPPPSHRSWKRRLAVVRLVPVDAVLSIARFGGRVSRLSTFAAARCVASAPALLVPENWRDWAAAKAEAEKTTGGGWGALLPGSERYGWTREAVSALFDVHGYQIFNQGLFNADPHPGNILIVQDERDPSKRPKIGLIDYGQVKSLDEHERVRVAKLILSIADGETDEVVADHFRNLGIKTKADSTRFLAEFGRLMFGPFEAKHLDHEWHRELHREDRVLYFPNELSMVYRTALLLRGLAMSLQYNPSVGEEWRHHAQEAINLHKSKT